MTAEHLVLIPGLLCTGRLFASQLDAFSDLVAISVADHTGHEVMSELAVSILDAAPPRFALAGLSMGGYAALEIMRIAPERVSSLCLLDTRARPDTVQETETRHRLLELCETAGVIEVQRSLLPRLVSPARLGEEPLVSEILTMAVDVGDEGFRRQVSAIMSRRDYRKILEGVECPTTIIVGAEDVITPPEMSLEMAGLIPAARLEVIAGCGHMSTMEQPELVNRIMLDWLDPSK